MTGSVSGRDRIHQRLGPDDIYDPRQIVGQDRESHFGGHFRKRFGEEVRRSHAGLHRAERMLDCLSTPAHGLWVCIKALLQLRADALAPIVESAALALLCTGTCANSSDRRGPVASYPLAICLARKAIWQLLPSRTVIGVFLRQNR